MPVETPDDQGYTPDPSTPPMPSTPLPVPGDPNFVGPTLPTPTLTPMAPGGLRGQARLQYEIATRPSFSSGSWDHDFIEWVLSLREDPSDAEYNSWLRGLKLKAQRIKRGEGSLGDTVSPLPAMATPDVGRQTLDREPVTATPSGTGRQSLDREPAFRAAPTGVGDPTDEEKAAERFKQRAGGDRFVGTPVDESGNSLAFPAGADPMLSRFMDINGKRLEGPQAEYAKRSGAFVYMGSQTMTSKEGFTTNRENYVYVNDARAGLVALGADRIKQYQGMLEMAETGVPDNDLQGLWNEAVRQAQLYAQAGIKMSVEEIFDGYVRANAAAIKARGGGGGSGFIGETPAEIAAIDYYRAMMQILGDISGVPSPAGGA